MDDLQLDRLFAAAGAARERAHAPYSGFRVGAAILDEQGEVHAGANVENVAYPQSQCAEASALGVMVAAGGRRAHAVLILAESAAPCPPCGGCRQRLAEFGAPDMPVLLAGPEGVRLRVTLGELLPMAFAAGEVGGLR
jgi:cytidine deaminase